MYITVIWEYFMYTTTLKEWFMYPSGFCKLKSIKNYSFQKLKPNTCLVSKNPKWNEKRYFFYRYSKRYSPCWQFKYSINVELTSTFLLYRGLVHHHHRILNIQFKGTVSVISSDPPLSDQGWIRYFIPDLNLVDG